MVEEQEKKVWIIGHKNPDTDSICAAIAYADLKRQTEPDTIFEAKRAGHINEETSFVLEHFGVEAPKLVTDVGAQIKDIAYRKTEGVSSHISIKRAGEMMKSLDVVSLPIRGADCHGRYREILYGCFGQPYSRDSQNTV